VQSSTRSVPSYLSSITIYLSTLIPSLHAATGYLCTKSQWVKNSTGQTSDTSNTLDVPPRQLLLQAFTTTHKK